MCRASVVGSQVDWGKRYVRPVRLAYPDPALTDGVVLLRPWTPGDLKCVEEAAADPTIPAGTSVPAVFSPEEGLAFIERQGLRIDHGEGVSMAVADAGTDRAVGLIWLPLRPQPGVVGLGYWVVPRARGTGVGTRAVRLATNWALTLSGAARVEAWVEPENAPSQRLLTAAGFVREGVLRSFLHLDDRRADAIVFSRVIQDLQSDNPVA
jgi:ribosomal-protein-alanine N-acetyltransferase